MIVSTVSVHFIFTRSSYFICISLLHHCPHLSFLTGTQRVFPPSTCSPFIFVLQHAHLVEILETKHDYTAHILHIHRVNNTVIKSVIAQLQYFKFFSQFWHFLIMTPASQLVSLHSTTHHPLGLDFRLFKDNPMAFWTSSSTTQFETPGTLITAVCVNTSQLSRDWPLLLQRNNLDARSGGKKKKQNSQANVLHAKCVKVSVFIIQ